jgi:hypothetical protein
METPLRSGSNLTDIRTLEAICMSVTLDLHPGSKCGIWLGRFFGLEAELTPAQFLREIVEQRIRDRGDDQRQET